MDDIEFQSIVVSEVQNALGFYDTEYARDRIRLHDYYMGEPLGNEQEGRSQVVSTEVADTIEMMMPSLMRIFSSTDRTVEFVPRGPEDVEAAAQATDYCNFIFNSDNDGFLTLHNWFKDGLLPEAGRREDLVGRRGTRRRGTLREGLSTLSCPRSSPILMSRLLSATRSRMALSLRRARKTASARL